jgi:hypothetical protein
MRCPHGEVEDHLDIRDRPLHSRTGSRKTCERHSSSFVAKRFEDTVRYHHQDCTPNCSSGLANTNEHRCLDALPNYQERTHPFLMRRYIQKHGEVEDHYDIRDRPLHSRTCCRKTCEKALVVICRKKIRRHRAQRYHHQNCTSNCSSGFAKRTATEGPVDREASAKTC